MARVGDKILVPYLANIKIPNNEYDIINKSSNKKMIEGEIIQIGECTIAIVERRSKNILEFLDNLQANKSFVNQRILNYLEEIKRQKKENPKAQLTIDILKNSEDFSEEEIDHLVQLMLFINNINGLIKSFQLVLVKVDSSNAFWYLLRDCDPESLKDIESDSGEISFHRHIPIGYDDEMDIEWYEDDIRFHNYCTQLETRIPGILTTIANWTKYGMLATAIRDFKIVEDLLRLPYVNRPDLIPYMIQHFKQDYANLKNLEAPSSTDIATFRGSFGFNKFHENFKVSTFIAISNNPLVAQTFVHHNPKKVKEFFIPKGFPIIDLREFNPQEGEILLLPPLSFKIRTRGIYNKSRLPGDPEYDIYNVEQKKGGTRKSKKRKSRKRS